MTTNTLPKQSLPFELGEPRSHGSLSVIPLFPTHESRVEYIGLDEAAARGLIAREVDEGGSVNTLVVDNPLDELVLLYGGEELEGAKQNRVVVWSTLVAPNAQLHVPVDCVERGRWAYRSRTFEPAPRAAYPELRRQRHVGGGQGEVWSSVAAKSVRLAAHSPTEAQEAMYDSRSGPLNEHLAELPRVPGQSGAIVGIGGEIVCLDYVSRPDVFAGLYAKLLRGYALDALELPVERPLAERTVDRFLRGLNRDSAKLVDPVGLGTDARFTGRVAGMELAAFGELVAVTAFRS